MFMATTELLDENVLEAIRNGEVIIHAWKKWKYIVPAWDAFGGNTKLKSQIPNYPELYKTIQNLSKPASWLWWELVQNRSSQTNVAVYKPANQVAINRLTVAYKELKKLDLVKRIKKQHYLINPIAYLPRFSKFDEVKGHWDSI
jgi:hypothetical protein